MSDAAHPPVRVLLVGPLPPPHGGIPAYVADLLSARIPGVEFESFNTAFPAWVAPLIRPGGAGWRVLLKDGAWAGAKTAVYVLLSYPALLWRIAARRPAIVQVFTCSYWGYWRNWLYILLAKACGRKTIFHLLNAIDAFYGNVGARQRRWIDRSLNSADLYLVQSPGLQQWTQPHSRRRVVGLWNGLHLDRIPPRGESPAACRGLDVPWGVTLGAVGKNKGTYDILNALHLLGRRNCRVGWIFVGGGEREAGERMAADLHLSDRVRFTGPVEEAVKWACLAHANFYGLPSYAEGQPISILEAMATARPVISTRVGSIPELIEDGESGFLVAPGAVDALASAIERLSVNGDLRRRMGARAQAVFTARHDVRVLYGALRRLYVELLEGRGA